jgi:hypothetical protein
MEQRLNPGANTIKCSSLSNNISSTQKCVRKSFSSFPSLQLCKVFWSNDSNHHHHPKKSIQESHPKKQSRKIMNHHHHPNIYAHIKTPTQTHKKKQ